MVRPWRQGSRKACVPWQAELALPPWQGIFRGRKDWVSSLTARRETRSRPPQLTHAFVILLTRRDGDDSQDQQQPRRARFKQETARPEPLHDRGSVW